MEADIDDGPKSMRDPAVRERRRQMLELPHMAKLNEYVAKLRKRPDVEVPDFDPLDGGVNATMLFLFEKPGPMTDKTRPGKRVGSGFISRNNDDETAKATFDFMKQAGISRRRVLLWNVIPWWNGTRKITPRELREGAECVKSLVKLLPELASVVMVGRRAEKASNDLQDTNKKLFRSFHPSPLVRARHPEKWNSIPEIWKQAAEAAECEHLTHL